ncbi:hypothetical protein PFICI_06134 [Pestalotiopsis fici W106-1]|uniref:Tyrosinase copper-binding domain-containing protein n=1 Tax=Pestalotiopsis fici (strain W106-1 / CGMCC3.15140) TaxID=1229662 RepID=W3X6V1_PESFW|nr:uncharacterized protein PFICI_06134 [Pestalotiopsis fici W106-1]ETS81132.1 hypothetical protein PFICI_06134 [Pestalotiopsis fici W106-1]
MASWYITVRLLFLVFVAIWSVSATIPQYTQEQINSGDALKDLSKLAYENAMSRLESNGTSGCNKDNVKVYKEWRNIPSDERIAYTKAVQCLVDKPGLMSIFEGSKTAFDDFTVLHILLTPYVHVSASFLLFHRYFLFTYAEKLAECGYTGSIPYWEWGLDCDDVDASPLFDGSATSLGSNGEKIANRTAPTIPGFDLSGMLFGTGGGCVHSGPFKNLTVNLGLITDPDPTRYAPRCLKRDLNPFICKNFASLRNTTSVILDSPNIELFQAIMQGDTRYAQARNVFFGVHGGGHFIIGGDPGGDFYFSPGEPAFYLHHGQLDRLYFIWQNLDWENRQNVGGTRSWAGIPLAQNATLDDTLPFPPLNKKRSLGELISTTAGPFCYVYE